jgi:ComF family protein
MTQNTWLQAAIELFFPPRCLCCRQPLAWGGGMELCAACLPKVALVAPPLCPCCGLMYVKSGGISHLCPLCRRQKYAFDRARAVCCYNDQIGALIHALKFAAKKTGLRTLAALAASSALTDLRPPDLIVPVPLHPRKLQSRGFNQSVLLAEIFFPDQRARICHCLRRSRHTRPQMGLTGEERRRNVVGAFAVVDPQLVRGSHVCLVDDVFTTGTTVNECAKTLKKAGAAGVEVATLAMVVTR